MVYTSPANAYRHSSLIPDRKFYYFTNLLKISSWEVDSHSLFTPSASPSCTCRRILKANSRLLGDFNKDIINCQS